MAHTCISKLDLLQIMAWHLFGTKPLSEPIPNYCQLDPWEQQISVKFWWKQKTIFTRKLIWRCHLEISVILSRPQCVNWKAYGCAIQQHGMGSTNIPKPILTNHLPSCGICLKVISVSESCMKYKLLQFHPHHPGSNGLVHRNELALPFSILLHSTIWVRFLHWPAIDHTHTVIPSTATVHVGTAAPGQHGRSVRNHFICNPLSENFCQLKEIWYKYLYECHVENHRFTYQLGAEYMTSHCLNTG